MSPAPELDPEFEALLDHLRDVRGADFTGYKRASLMRLVTRRMHATGHTDFRSYQDHLEVDPAEFAALFDTLLINVTSFFRDPETWAVLREDVLPPLLAELPADAPVRVWSAACASGEEAYTLAITMAELLGEDQFRSRVKVYATDIDEDALLTARAGRFPRQALDAVPTALVSRYFEGDGDELSFRSDLRSSIVFGRHDLIQDAPISRITLLSCRNALMYFNVETQTRVLERFSFALQDPGVLLLGRAEMLLTHSDLFRPLDLQQRIFGKARAGERVRTPGRGRVDSHDTALRRVAHAAFANAPDAQVVLDEGGALSLVNDSAVRMLGLSVHDVGRPFQDLPLSYRPVELRTAVDTVRSDRAPVALADVRWRRDDGDTWYDVQVQPLVEGDSDVLGVQITFVDVTRYHQLSRELEQAHDELQTAYEELQSANEELETTNEELQSAVEELETTNEELQSTNEELETMNEELQSTNEELQTLNDELRERTAEVNQVNAFLESILMGLRGAVVVLDRDLVVRVWNQRAEKMWGLREHEAQGGHFLGFDIGLPVDAVRAALRSVVGGTEEAVELTVPAVNRLGREVLCAISCTALRGPRGHVDGAILVMEETVAED